MHWLTFSPSQRAPCWKGDLSSALQVCDLLAERQQSCSLQTCMMKKTLLIRTQYKHKLTHRAEASGHTPVMLRRCGYVIPQQSFRTAGSMLAPAEMARRRRPRDAFIELLKDRDEDNGCIYKIGFSSALPPRPHSRGTRM